MNPLRIESEGVAVISLPYPVSELDGQPVQLISSAAGKLEGIVKIAPIPAFGSKKLLLGERASVVPSIPYEAEIVTLKIKN